MGLIFGACNPGPVEIIKVFQVEADFVVSPELGVKLGSYIKEFQNIFGIS